MEIKRSDKAYFGLIDQIGQTFQKAKRKAFEVAHHEMLWAYWEIGQHIVEFEQKGKLKAEYGKALMIQLSRDLKGQHGKGFSRSNLTYMRMLYIKYPKRETLSHKLSWSHYFELLKISDDTERNFYEKQTVIENWSIRELKRQKGSALFQRMALSKNKEEILQLSQEGNKLDNDTDIIKDPYIFEFLELSERGLKTESELEYKLVQNLQQFLLELGKGFAFIGRQYRISIANRHFHVDLVFYHRILKCFVLIDLKVKEVKHEDIGQMNLYLNYFEKEESTEGDAGPIGIILSADKDDVIVEYATGGLSNKLFVSKYQLYLPDKKELQKRVRMIMEETTRSSMRPKDEQ